jgi:hypothetical protein
MHCKMTLPGFLFSLSIHNFMLRNSHIRVRFIYHTCEILTNSQKKFLCELTVPGYLFFHTVNSQFFISSHIRVYFLSSSCNRKYAHEKLTYPGMLFGFHMRNSHIRVSEHVFYFLTSCNRKYAHEKLTYPGMLFGFHMRTHISGYPNMYLKKFLPVLPVVAHRRIVNFPIHISGYDIFFSHIRVYDFSSMWTVLLRLHGTAVFFSYQ